MINYDFPSQSKLFIHRAGRVARAGRAGSAYSLVTPAELAYMVDLYLFLGRPLLNVPPVGSEYDSKIAYYGTLPEIGLNGVHVNP